jgi:hypothetical protein
VIQTQWVCFGNVCSCSGDEHSCNCVPLHGDRYGVCLCCREPVHEIDANTSDILYPASRGERRSEP